MKTTAIKKLVESYTITQLLEAEKAITDEQIPEIDIDGEDEGEQLTHVLASIYIKTKMEKEGIAFNMALRDFSQRVRKSIS